MAPTGESRRCRDARPRIAFGARRVERRAISARIRAAAELEVLPLDSVLAELLIDYAAMSAQARACDV